MIHHCLPRRSLAAPNPDVHVGQATRKEINGEQDGR